MKSKSVLPLREAGRLAIICVSMALCLSGPTAPAGEADTLRKTSKGFTAVAKQAIPAVVFIEVEKTLRIEDTGARGFNDPYSFFGDDFMERFFGERAPMRSRPRQFRQVGQGSGFIITKDGYILTNNHVVGDADRITVKLHDGREFQAKRIGADPRSEVAVIKIEGRDFPYVELGDSDAMEIGEWVIAIGTPFGLSETLTVGVVSAKGRSNIGIADYEDFIQTDAAINPGNSGGPLLNIDGKVIGINTAIFSESGGYMGIGFAIPINMARVVKDQIVKTGRVTRGQLGVAIQPVTRVLADSFGLPKAEGILVSDVVKDSPAEKAGLKQGDIILRLNDKPVESVASFRNEIAMTAPRAEAALAVFRDRHTTTVKVQVGEMAGERQAAVPPAEAPPVADKLGISVNNLTPEIAAHFGYDAGEGVVVTQVEDQSLAFRAGLQAGSLITSVNRTKVTSVEEYKRALAESEKTKMVLLLVKEGQHSRFIALNLE